MKWARVEKGKVMEITDVDPTDRFVKEIEEQFFPCPNEVGQGYIYENGVFRKPTLPAQQIIIPTTDPITADMWQAILDLSAQFEALKGGN